MNALYNTAIHALKCGLKIHSSFNSKSMDGVRGRKNWRKNCPAGYALLKEQDHWYGFTPHRSENSNKAGP